MAFARIAGYYLAIDILTIDRLLVLAATCGYALLFVRLIESTAMVRAPVFTVYVGMMAAGCLFWNPHGTAQIAVGALLMAMRGWVLIEAYQPIAGELSSAERRWLPVLVLLPVALGAIWTRSYFTGSLAMDWYKAARQQAHLAFAIASLFGTLALWIHPPRLHRKTRNHGLILTGYLMAYGAIGFVNAGKGQGEKWYTADALFWVATVVCIAAWLRLVIPQRAKALFDLSHPVG